MTSPSADVVVVLGARVRPDGSLGPALERRVRRGARAWHDGVAPLVLCTGGQTWSGHPEALRMREELLRLGVDERCVMTELFALNTAENAFYSSRLMRLVGLRSAALVTCPWHMPRALRNFARCGVRVHPIPADPGPRTRGLALWRGASELVSMALDGLLLRSKARPG